MHLDDILVMSKKETEHLLNLGSIDLVYFLSFEWNELENRLPREYTGCVTSVHVTHGI